MVTVDANTSLTTASLPQPDGAATEAPSVEDGSSAGDWYAVQTKRFQEHRVVRHLSIRAIPTFLPLMEPFHRRGRGRCLEPLFPGYLFVQLPALTLNSTRWHIARWTPGVRRILGAEQAPVPMPAEAMELIRAQVRELGFVRLGARFTSGARVRICSGPLAGLEAIFDSPISREGRVRILLELLGQVGKVEVDEVDLESA